MNKTLAVLLRCVVLNSLGVAVVFGTCGSVSGTPQAKPPTPHGIVGWWEWRGPLNARKEQRTFFLQVTRVGNTVRGAYSVIDWRGGTPLVEDGNQTPFEGSVRGNIATIEFDPTDVHPGYESGVQYRAPKDGRRPSRARLRLGRGRLEWRLQSGAAIEGVPRRMVLSHFRG